VTLTIDVTGLPATSYLFAPSPESELTAALHLLVEHGHHPAQAAQVQAMSAAAGQDLVDRAVAFGHLWDKSCADFLLPSRPAATLALELDAIDELDDERWVDNVLVSCRCGALARSMGLGNVLSDERAVDLARDRAAASGPTALAFVNRILDDPTKVRGEVRLLLEDCQEAFFDQVWRTLVAHLTVDARHKTDLLWTQGPARALAAVAPSVRLDEQADRIVIDKLVDVSVSARGTGVTFHPTVLGDPHTLVVQAPGWQPVVRYPVTGRDAAHVAWEGVQQRLRALDHPLRLRLGRSLVAGPHTTTELADIWEVSAPEVSRHLAVLRDAGLVTVERRGRYVTYRLDVPAVARLGADVLEAMLR
jgi:DNA-binding transcriptional ArsR family regulator